MKILARLDVAHPPALAAYEPALLLEGSWPNEHASPHRRCLDDEIDARDGWIDEEAERLVAETAARASSSSWRTFIELNQLKLRYLLVKLLRPLAFFRRQEVEGRRIDLCAAADADDVYAALFDSLAKARGWQTSGHETRPVEGFSDGVAAADEPRSAAEQPRSERADWRRWAGGALQRRESRALAGDRRTPIVFCGNRRLLEPVCRELASRGCAAVWLYERFAFKTWLRLGRLGVRQWTCEHACETPAANLAGPALVAPLVSRGVDLAAALNAWLARLAVGCAARQHQWMIAMRRHFTQGRPAALVLDEDATPFARAAILAARELGVPAIVVQHGAPRVRFGFAPPLADATCVWGESSRRTLRKWGAAADRIQVTGAPFVQQPRTGRRPRSGKSPELLLLATTPPRDARPDAVSFHLTTASHEAMLRLACRAAARRPGARLTIKLHPRCRDRRPFERILAEFPQLRRRIVAGSSLEKCLARADCVLNCTSSAGIEAAYAGHPVIELLPAGGDDLLPAVEWGARGTARNDEELDALLQQVLDQRSATARQKPSENVFAAVGDDAAARVADAILRECAADRPTAAAARSAARAFICRTLAEEVAASL